MGAASGVGVAITVVVGDVEGIGAISADSVAYIPFVGTVIDKFPRLVVGELEARGIGQLGIQSGGAENKHGMCVPGIVL